MRIVSIVDNGLSSQKAVLSDEDGFECVGNLLSARRTCPLLTSTRSCYDSIAILFHAENYQTILPLRFDVSEEIFAYSMMLEPLYGLITAFEDRNTRFYMLAPMID
jgi:hypothetical protein